jgi:hypothetical protein
VRMKFDLEALFDKRGQIRGHRGLGHDSGGIIASLDQTFDSPHPPPTTRVTTLAVYSTIGTMRA